MTIIDTTVVTTVRGDWQDIAEHLDDADLARANGLLTDAFAIYDHARRIAHKASSDTDTCPLCESRR